MACLGDPCQVCQLQPMQFLQLLQLLQHPCNIRVHSMLAQGKNLCQVLPCAYVGAGERRFCAKCPCQAATHKRDIDCVGRVRGPIVRCVVIRRGVSCGCTRIAVSPCCAGRVASAILWRVQTSDLHRHARQESEVAGQRRVGCLPVFNE
jgi:hypothetical protein